MSYVLKVKFDRFKPEISRTLTVPSGITFDRLCGIFEIAFALSPYHLSTFSFPGINAVLWDFDKTDPDETCMDMKDVVISDYLDLFRKFYWRYDLSRGWSFTVKVKKSKKKTDYPFVSEGEYNLPEDYDFFTAEDHPDFDIDETNERLRMMG